MNFTRAMFHIIARVPILSNMALYLVLWRFELKWNMTFRDAQFLYELWILGKLYGLFT